MSVDIRFHLDENVHHAVADGLRRRGVEVTTSPEAGLRSAEDERHVEFARSEGRVIFTHDPDFLRLNALGVNHHGIAFCQVGTRSIGEIIRALFDLWLHETAEAMQNRVMYL
jgi:predicted nuclease of predicted toxin-antitoxin system